VAADSVVAEADMVVVMVASEAMAAKVEAVVAGTPMFARCSSLGAA
jgi:hypothetical protein